MRTEILIIGGGAAGLAAACALSNRRRVVLLEKQPRVGRKLLATGNGRCNMTRLGASARDYHGSPEAAEKVNRRFPPEKVRAFFESIGLMSVADDVGRVYPRSNQAASVLDALRLCAQERGCEMICDCAAQSIRPMNGGYEVRAGERTFFAKKVLIAAGGLAGSKLGACGDGYRLFEQLGHSSAPRFPAIAALKTPPEQVRGLKGQRIECRITLEIDAKTARTETGEALFNEDGVSGIAAMQLARECNSALRAGKKCRIAIRILDSGGESAVRARVRSFPERPIEDLLSGIVPKRVGMAIAKTAGVEPLTRAAGTLNEREMKRLGALLESWQLDITGTQGFEQAQVTAGGVRMDAFDWNTLESKKHAGVYIAGEVADVDGDCGGYNLQWAFASALTAAEAIDKALG